MTFIAGKRVVAVISHFIVPAVGGRLIVTAETVKCRHAACGVAKFAGDIMRACAREGMLEGCRLPRGGIVAMLTIMREVESRVVRRPLVISGVT